MAEMVVGSAPKWFNCWLSQLSESCITNSERCAPSSSRNAASNCCLSCAPSSGIGLIRIVTFGPSPSIPVRCSSVRSALATSRARYSASKRGNAVFKARCCSWLAVSTDAISGRNPPLSVNTFTPSFGNMSLRSQTYGDSAFQSGEDAGGATHWLSGSTRANSRSTFATAASVSARLACSSCNWRRVNSNAAVAAAIRSSSLTRCSSASTSASRACASRCRCGIHTAKAASSTSTINVVLCTRIAEKFMGKPPVPLPEDESTLSCEHAWLRRPSFLGVAVFGRLALRQGDPIL